jgi:hypothetical protein
MPSAARRPKNPCRASLIKGWSVGDMDRPNFTPSASGGGTLLTLAASRRGPLLTLPRPRGRVGWEQAEGTPALHPESTCHMHYFRRACGRWSKRHCGVPANPRTLGESDTSRRDHERPERAAHDSRSAPSFPFHRWDKENPLSCPALRGGQGAGFGCIGWIMVPPAATSWRVRPVTLKLVSHDRWFGYVAGRYRRARQQPG